MNSRELFRAVFSFEEIPRPPIWMMRQAGRHLPEYRNLRKNRVFEDLLFDPALTAEVTLQPVDRYDLDAAIIFSDILLPFYEMGTELQIVPGVGPVLKNRVVSADDVNSLSIPSDSVFQSLRKGIRIVRKELPEKAVIGFAGAPYTLSSYIIEGKSTRDSLLTKSFATKYSEAYYDLLSLLKEIVKLQLMQQIKEGVDFVQIFDSWASHLSADQYREFVFSHTQSLIEDIQKKVPVIFYARGSSHLLPILKDLGADGYSIDHTVTIPQARAALSKPTVIQGNLDPAYLLAGGTKLKEQVDRILKEGMYFPGFIFNLAQGVNKETPVENVEFVVRRVKEV